MMPRSIALASAMLVVLAGCASSAAVSPGFSPTSAPVQPSPSATGSMVQSAASPSPAASASAIAALACEADVRVTGINDYAPDAEGVDDIVSETEAFPVFARRTRLLSMGWSPLLSATAKPSSCSTGAGRMPVAGCSNRNDGCQDPDSMPMAQTGTAIGEVVADGVRVRSMPTVHPALIEYVPLLRRGDRVLVAGGPVSADGYDWFLVDTLYESGEPPLFGWASLKAAAARRGSPGTRTSIARRCPRTRGGLASRMTTCCFTASVRVTCRSSWTRACPAPGPPGHRRPRTGWRLIAPPFRVMHAAPAACASPPTRTPASSCPTVTPGAGR